MLCINIGISIFKLQNIKNKQKLLGNVKYEDRDNIISVKREVLT